MLSQRDLITTLLKQSPSPFFTILLKGYEMKVVHQINLLYIIYKEERSWIMKKGGLESEVPKNRVFGWCRVLYGT